MTNWYNAPLACFALIAVSMMGSPQSMAEPTALGSNKQAGSTTLVVATLAEADIPADVLTRFAAIDTMCSLVQFVMAGTVPLAPRSGL